MVDTTTPRSQRTSADASEKPPSAHISDQAAAAIPVQLRAKPRWLVWKYQRPNGEAKWRKPPINPRTGKAMDGHDPRNLMTFEKARQLSRQRGDGIGYRLDAGEAAIDLDHCFDAQGRLQPWAKAIVRALDSYTERSPSGQGAHILLQGRKPGPRCKRANVEVYDHTGNYLTVTGNHLEGTPRTVEQRQQPLEQLYATALEEIPTGGGGQGSADPRDEELLAKARNSDPDFVRLFDRGELAGTNASSADLALMNKLAFWFGCDPERMERVFGRSALGRRDKWTGRADYRRRTIATAIAGCQGVYTGRRPSPSGRDSGNGRAPAPDARTAPEARPVFANTLLVADEGGKDVRRALTMAELLRDLHRLAGPWPRRLQERLFVRSAAHQPVYLDTPTQLFGWLDGLARVHWSDGAAMITQARFFEHLRRFADAVEVFDAIETLPHHPPLAATYYLHREVAVVRRSRYLDEFLGFFTPASDGDRVLFEAAILTLFWGGPAGQRPAFRFRGGEEDPPEMAGRGTGKTTAVELIADLAGGLIDLEEGEDITGLKTRLLSSEEGRKRVVRIDNLKTLKLSWAALEKFISSKVISGHALYRGECQRPNTVTVFLTLNRGTFSKDMAQRVIEIRLRRPAYSAHWLDRVRGFLDRHRWDLIGEVLGALADEPARIETRSRWPAWEQGVLAQCPDFTAAVQDEIARRVEAMDDDDADALECEEFYRAKLLLWKHNPETQRVRIPTAINAEWLSEYAKRPYSASEATLALSIKPLTRLLYQRSRTARYWLWVPGPEVTSEPVDLGPRPAF